MDVPPKAKNSILVRYAKGTAESLSGVALGIIVAAIFRYKYAEAPEGLEYAFGAVIACFGATLSLQRFFIGERVHQDLQDAGKSSVRPAIDEANSRIAKTSERIDKLYSAVSTELSSLQSDAATLHFVHVDLHQRLSREALSGTDLKELDDTFSLAREIAVQSRTVKSPHLLRLYAVLYLRFREQILCMSSSMSSRPLSRNEFYAWLNGTLETLSGGDHLWALSTMQDGEWDDSSEESRFNQLIREAVDRGVVVQWYFILKSDRESHRLDNDYIRWQLDDERVRTDVLYIDKMAPNERARRLTKGFVAINDDAVLEDSSDLRYHGGELHTSKSKIEQFRAIYSGLNALAKKSLH